MDTSTLLVGGIPIALVIFGLVEFSKTFGLAGKWLTALSMFLGVVLGILYKMATSGIPVGFGWFEVAIFGLALGLTASGFYKFVDARLPAVTDTPKEPLPDPVLTALKNFGTEIAAATNKPVPGANTTPSPSMVPPVETGTIDGTAPKGEDQELAQG